MNKPKNSRNISEVVREYWCAGCGTCVAFCPERALEIEYTVDGRYVPRVIESKCTNCGSCVDLCPAANENFKQLNQFVFDRTPENKLLGNYINCFTGYSEDESLRFKATSGGIVISLLVFALEKGFIDGAILTRVNREDPLKAEAFIARTAEQIYSAMGAKYVPVPLNLLLRNIISEEGRFAVVGLPCHIWGLRRAEMKSEKLRSKLVYHIGLLCSHTISFRGIELVLEKMNVATCEIDKLQYRGDGWPSGLKVILKDKTEKYMANLNSWWTEIFGGYYFSHYYCTLCNDQFNEFADISLGDAWLTNIVRNDKIGTSIVITKTGTGQDLIDKAVDEQRIRLFPLDPYDALRSQSVPVLFKKRNIMARMKVLAFVGKKLPKNLRENKDHLFKPTLLDYPAAIIVYTNRLISRNRILKKILKYIPFIVLRFNRIIFKQLLAYNKEDQFENLRFIVELPMVQRKVNLIRCLVRFFKRFFNFALNPLRSQTVRYEGIILPAKHLRFGGEHFRKDKDFFDSACREAERLVQYCGLTPDSRVLEIGGGPGRLPIGILQKVGDVRQYSDVDVDRKSVEWCERYIHSDHPSFTFTHIDVANLSYNKKGPIAQTEIRLPFADLTFDIIYLYSVFSHLTRQDIKAYCREFQRLLHPEGKVFITTFVEEDVPEMIINPQDYQGRRWTGPLHCVRYNREFMEQLYKEHGFVVERFEYGEETDGQSAYYLSKAGS